MNDQNQISNNLRRSAARQIKLIAYKVFDQTGVIQEVEQLTSTNKSVNDVQLKVRRRILLTLIHQH